MKVLNKIAGIFRAAHESPVLIFIRAPLAVLFLPLDLLYHGVAFLHTRTDRFVDHCLLPNLWELEDKYEAWRHNRSATA